MRDSGLNQRNELRALPVLVKTDAISRSIKLAFDYLADCRFLQIVDLPDTCPTVKATSTRATDGFSQSGGSDSESAPSVLGHSGNNMGMR